MIQDINRKLSFSWDIRIRLSISVIWLIILLSLPYLIWEIFWAVRVGYPFIKWHTHLMLFFYLWVVGYLILHYLIKKLWPEIYMTGLTLHTAVIVALFIGELFLIVTKINETTLEKLGDGYFSWYDPSPNENWYHASPSSNPHWIVKPEYKYIREGNSLGFSDMEWPARKRKNEKRILALGDSFTEGDGAPYDSCYVTQLRKKIQATDSTTYVMNAGICGCDPFINYVNYRDRLLKYKPDVILQTLSSGDINVDIIVRGGMERFKTDGTVQYVKAPVWEPIYAISDLSRLYFSAIGYDQLLMKSSIIPDNKKRLDSIVVDLFRQYAALAKANNCRLVIILQPFLFEVNSQKYQYDFSAMLDKVRKIDNVQVYDLMPFYTSYIKEHNKTPADYYWPMDGHHNSAGYTMMADGIYSFAAVK